MSNSIRPIHAIVVAVLLLFLAAVALLWWRQTNAPERESVDNNPITITFAGFAGQRAGFETRMASFSEANPGIRVQFVSAEQAGFEPGSRSFDMRRLAELADTMIYLPQAAPGGTDYFLDLQPLAAGDSFDESDFWPGATAGCSPGDRLVALPVNVGLDVIYYDGAVFDAAAIARPRPGWTWSDFRATAAQLTQHEGERVSRYGFVPLGGSGALLNPLIAERLPANGRLDVTAMVEAMDWYVGLAQDAVVAAGDPDVALDQLIGGGQAAIWVDNQANLPKWRRQLGDQISLAPFPVDETASATTPAYAYCVAASVGTGHPQEAWQWLNYLTEAPLATFGPGIPARRSVALGIAYWQEQLATPDSPLAFALDHAWYGQNREALAAVTAAIDQAAVGALDLSAAVAAIEQLPPTSTAEPTGAPVVVATPQVTSTPGEDGHTTAGTSSIHFVHLAQLGHSSTAALRQMGDTFNSSRSDFSIDVGRPGFGGTFSIVDVIRDHDCLSISSSLVDSTLSSELFYDLTPLLTAAGDDLAADFQPGLLDYLRTDDHLYVLPLTVTPGMLRYNATQLSLLGLETPEYDWTLAELLALAETAVDVSGGGLYGFAPLDDGSNENGLELFLRDQGVVLFDLAAQPPQINFDRPETITAVAEIIALSQANVLLMPFDPPSFSGTSQRQRAVLAGEVVFWNYTPHGFSSFAEENTTFRIGELPLPAIPDLAQRPSVVGLAISKDTVQPQACWEWFTFLSEQAKLYGESIPARQSMMNSAEWESSVGDEQLAFLQTAAERLFPLQPAVNGGLEWPLQLWWREALRAAFDGDDVAEALAAAQMKGEAYLACLAPSAAPGREEIDACAAAVDP